MACDKGSFDANLSQVIGSIFTHWLYYSHPMPERRGFEHMGAETLQRRSYPTRAQLIRPEEVLMVAELLPQITIQTLTAKEILEPKPATLESWDS